MAYRRSYRSYRSYQKRALFEAVKRSGMISLGRQSFGNQVGLAINDMDVLPIDATLRPAYRSTGTGINGIPSTANFTQIDIPVYFAATPGTAKSFRFNIGFGTVFAPTAPTAPGSQEPTFVFGVGAALQFVGAGRVPAVLGMEPRLGTTLTRTIPREKDLIAIKSCMLTAKQQSSFVLDVETTTKRRFDDGDSLVLSIWAINRDDMNDQVVASGTRMLPTVTPSSTVLDTVYSTINIQTFIKKN